jgi:hypothetical protein
MTCALAGRGRRSVRNDENVLDVVHGNPSASICHISSATERLSQRAACRTVRENKLYQFHAKSVAAGDKYFRLQFAR